MPQFLDLPRELRDMIYWSFITSELPRPTLGEAHWLFRFRRVFEPESSQSGEYGCAYSLEEKPSTCANLLCCNRQIYAEMRQMIRLARRKAMMPVKLDCIAEDESFHYFTWLAIPLVRTREEIEIGKSRILPAWADRILERYFSCTHRMLSSGCLACKRSTTLIEQLWVDVRIFGDRAGKWFRNSNPPDRISWAVCAALKHVLERGPNFSRLKDLRSVVMVEELVLNVVTPPNVPKEKYLAEDVPIDELRDGLVHPKTVAKELLDVWNTIWRADEFKGKLYRVLIERIGKVRICIDGDTYRVRELQSELKRGQAERLRIAARVGW